MDSPEPGRRPLRGWATELHKDGTVYVMDEPTTGLHMSDVGHLLEIIERLAGQGNFVIVIEHNLDVIKNADWVIDLGPDGGTQGGQIVFEGTPRQLLAATGSHTADFLRRDVDASPALRTFNQPWKDDGMNQPLGLAR